MRGDRDGGDRVSAATRIYRGTGALLAGGVGGGWLERGHAGLANQAGWAGGGRWWGVNTGKWAVQGWWGPVEAREGPVGMSGEACGALAKGYGGRGWSETGPSAGKSGRADPHLEWSADRPGGQRLLFRWTRAKRLSCCWA